MKCNGCGNEKAYTTYQSGNDPECCDRCGNAAPPATYDTFFKGQGQTFSNLTDKMGNPVEFMSRGHKARWMKENNVQEVGDRVKGAYFSSQSYEKNTQSKESRRGEVKQALKSAIDTMRKKYRN